MCVGRVNIFIHLFFCVLAMYVNYVCGFRQQFIFHSKYIVNKYAIFITHWNRMSSLSVFSLLLAEKDNRYSSVL